MRPFDHGICLLVLQLLLSGAAERPSVLGKLHHARQTLEVAFAQPDVVRNDLVLDAFTNLLQVGDLVTRVMRGGFRSLLYDEHGQVEQQLSLEDQAGIQAYMDEKVFVLGDVLALVMLPHAALLETLDEEATHPVLRRRRIIAMLRLSWWMSLTQNTSCWAVPFFGALASIARRMRREHEGTQQLERDEEDDQHLKVLTAPLLTAEYTRSVSFQRASAFLAVARGKTMVEAAERHFKAFDHSSLRIILEHATQWPVFDSLHVLARKAHMLIDDRPMYLESGNSTVIPQIPKPHVGGQALSPAVVLELYRMLHVFGSLCSTFGLQWWVSHGTLIGAMRDGGLSRHAEDCEVDIAEGDVELLQGIGMRRALARNGYEISFDPRGRCFKIWPMGSPQAPAIEDQLLDQSWWLPQQRIGTPSLDVYIVQSPLRGQGDRHYVSNEEFHCNAKVCTQVWHAGELDDFLEVPFGSSQVRVPIGASSYLSRVYGSDWQTTVRPHRWAAELGYGFTPISADQMVRKAAEPFGPLVMPVIL